MPVYSNHNNIKNQKQQNLNSKIGIALICVASVFLINLLFNLAKFINSILLGSFGLFSYAIFISVIVIGVMLIKNVKVKLETGTIALLIFWLLFIMLLLQTASSSQFLNLGYGEYISACYINKLTAGGAITAIVLYPISFLCTHIVATYVILSIALLIFSAVLLVRFVNYSNTNIKVNKNEYSKPEMDNEDDYNEEQNEEFETEQYSNNVVSDSIDDLIIPDSDAYDTPNSSQVILENNEEDKIKAKTILGLSNEKPEPNYQNNTERGYISELEPTFGNKFDDFDKKYGAKPSNKPAKFFHSTSESPAKPDKKLSESDKENIKYLKDIMGAYYQGPTQEQQNKHNNFNKQNAQNNQFEEDNDYDVMRHLYDENVTQRNYERTYKPNNNNYNQNNNHNNNNQFNNNRQNNNFNNNNNNNNNFNPNRQNGFNVNRNNNQNSQNGFKPQQGNMFNQIDAQQDPEENNNTVYENNFANNNKIETEPVNHNYKQVKIEELEGRDKPKKKLYRKPPKYNKPPIDLLKSYEASSSKITEVESEKAKRLEETLDSFNIPAKVISIVKGPAITRYELQMQPGCSVKKVVNHVYDISMSIESPGDIRTEIPIPGKNAFGVEVPNESIDMVGLREVLESYNFQGNKSPVTFALGKDIIGQCRVARVDKMPHLLVAGSTGSGKSVCLNALLISLLYKASPQDLKILLVDPKQVEFSLYNGLPHLLIPKAITDTDKAVMAVDWLVSEMERRFTLFAQAKVKDLEEYNNTEEVISELNPKLPSILVILDEFGDLILNAKKDLEDKIIKLTQKARAAGIHLVLATQRPSVDTIPGRIKNNLNTRIAFAVTSFADSKTILDQGGAENLLGRGDMLYSSPSSSTLDRIQGAFVSSKEIEAVVEYVKENNECEFDEEIEDAMFNKQQGGFNVEGPAAHQQFDPLLKDAARIAITSGNISVSKLQRHFGIGFPRAGKIIDQMEQAKFIGPQDSKKMRPIYITQQEFEERFGEDL